MPWDTFRSRLVIEGELVCRTALRVGRGGEAAEPTATDLPLLTDADNRPFIPGSSLRGVLRAHIERIVRTLEPHSGSQKGACNPVVESELCVTSEDMRAWREEAARRERRGPRTESETPDEPPADRWLSDQVWDRSCRVCRVFGSPWLASRVRLSDLHCVHGGTTEIRDGVSIDRDKETVADKYDFEVVPAGTRFGLHVVAENLDERERGLLWLGFSELGNRHTSVGGFKGRGLGRIELDPHRLTIRLVQASDRREFKRYILSGGKEMSSVDPEQARAWIEALWQEWEGTN